MRFIMIVLLAALTACNSTVWQNSVSNSDSQRQKLTQEEIERLYVTAISNNSYLAFAETHLPLANALILYQASSQAIDRKQYTKGFFFFEAANARAKYELETCLPHNQQALQQMEGFYQTALNKLNVIQQDINTVQIAELFRAFDVLPGANFLAGWDCRFKVLDSDKREVADGIKAQKQKVMDSVLLLLSDEEYLRSARYVDQYLPVFQQGQLPLFRRSEFQRHVNTVLEKEAFVSYTILSSRLLQTNQ